MFEQRSLSLAYGAVTNENKGEAAKCFKQAFEENPADLRTLHCRAGIGLYLGRHELTFQGLDGILNSGQCVPIESYEPWFRRYLSNEQSANFVGDLLSSADSWEELAFTYDAAGGDHKCNEKGGGVLEEML